MSLPLKPPIEPALARGAKALPEGEQWAYEPKYDGFRALVFVDGAELYIQSRGKKPLARYFPELSFPSGRYVLDGEIVIDSSDGHEDFGSLQSRLHPAESRIKLLSEQIPARFIAFDLLALNDESLISRAFEARREALETLALPGVDLTPLTRTPADCEPWLATGEGVVAKLTDAAYAPGKRTGMVKVKRVRTIDAVVVGYRPGIEADTVGSLILGLYQGDTLRPVGHCSGFKATEKHAVLEKLGAYETGEHGSGDPSRWATERDLEWVALRPELVVEVSYDHASGGRIRHGTKLLRWREDKPPRECLYEQLT
ncbi:MAG: ATP-dependent DNA ligase [Solirubrobacterales bacterium]|nr:ATP-dependent DNA ligase [Solirubrobacterales bacterium]